MGWRLRAALLAPLCTLPALVMSTTTGAASASASTQCGGGVPITETMRAPDSVPAGQSFTITVHLHNCTASTQTLTLEGRLHEPTGCSAPVIDPLQIHLAPQDGFTLHVDAPGSSCTGTYTVTWWAAKNSTVVASRTRHVAIT